MAIKYRPNPVEVTEAVLLQIPGLEVANAETGHFRLNGVNLKNLNDELHDFAELLKSRHNIRLSAESREDIEGVIQRQQLLLVLADRITVMGGSQSF